MIKNENDLLGLIIKNKDRNNEIKVSRLFSVANTDSISLQELVNRLVKQKYLIYSTDILSLTDLGIRNYVSPTKKFFLWFAKLLILTIKELIVYIFGIISGVAIAYLSNMLIK